MQNIGHVVKSCGNNSFEEQGVHQCMEQFSKGSNCTLFRREHQCINARECSLCRHTKINALVHTLLCDFNGSVISGHK